MNTGNTQNPSIPTNIDYGKLTREYLLPDLHNCDPDGVTLPKVAELMVLGQNNLYEVRRICRKMEREIVEKANLAMFSERALEAAEQFDFVRYISHQEIETYTESELQELREKGVTSMCDWHGGALAEQWAADKLPPDEHKQRCKELAQKSGKCRYGEMVAEWCPLAPYPQGCEYGCKKCAVPPEIGNPDSKAKYCQHRQDCLMAEQPFLDKPCVLAHGDEATRQSCLAYLRAQGGLWQRRRAKIREYISLLTAAMRLADKNVPLAPIWRYRKNWTVIPQTLMLAVTRDESQEPSVYRLTLHTVIGMDNVRARAEMTPGVRLDVDGKVGYYHLKTPYIFKLGEVPYLFKHREYLKWWLSWSWTNPKDELAQSVNDLILQLFDTMSDDYIATLQEDEFGV